MPKLQGLLFNQDCTDFFYQHAIGPGVDGGALLDEYIDILAEAGVTVMMCNTNARKTNYRSAVWEAFWDGYDPDGPDDQPYFRAVPEGDVAGYRRLVGSMLALREQGVDYPARVISRCRQRGISPWITLRMNDVHFNDNLEHPFHGVLWRDAKYHRGGGPSYYARGLDYTHRGVRDMYRGLVVETLERYDIDGLELDFMREPYLFRPGAEEEGAVILREWLRGIRVLVHSAAEGRGHPIRLGVRVPSRVEVARSWGLDAVGWAEEGLVDLVVVTPRWSTLEYDMPVAEWRDLLGGTGVTLAGGLEVLHRPIPSGPANTVTPEQAAGAATAVLAGGADAVYLFNYFAGLGSHPGWPRDAYLRTLGAMSSIEELSKLPRRHAITWRDITGRDEQYQAPLPAEGQVLTFFLPTGPRPPQTAEASLELRVDQPAEGGIAPPAVSVNDGSCEHRARRPAADNTSILEYTVPVDLLPGRQRDTIKVTAAEGTTVKVLGVEIRIAPAG